MQKNSKTFKKKGLTFKNICDIIYESQRSGCGAAGSALPWGGRGRKFKSCHSDQNRAVSKLLDFLYFTRFWGVFLLFEFLCSKSFFIC